MFAAGITTRTGRPKVIWRPTQTMIRRSQKSRSGQYLLQILTAAPVQVATGDEPALSAKGQLAFVKDGQIWTAPLPAANGSTGKAQRLLFDHGKDDAPVWSPDGTRLAFVSGRDDHSFVCIYTSAEQPLLYLAPSTSFDKQPLWSPDGRSIAFLRQPSHGDAPLNFTVQEPRPFAFWTADATTGQGRKVWSSPETTGRLAARHRRE